MTQEPRPSPDRPIPSRRRLLRAGALAGLAALVATRRAGAQPAEAWYPVTGDDGKPVANMRVPIELTAEVEELPGLVSVGPADAEVTLVEFFDYNCPWCRLAVRDLDALVRSTPGLRLGLVNNAILSSASVEAAKIELALLRRHGPAAAYGFHRRLFETRGVIDAVKALAVGEELGWSRAALEQDAARPETARDLERQMTLAASLGFFATPSFLIGGAGMMGYPGPKTLAGLIASVRACDQIVCP